MGCGAKQEFTPDPLVVATGALLPEGNCPVPQRALGVDPACAAALHQRTAGARWQPPRPPLRPPSRASGCTSWRASCGQRPPGTVCVVPAHIGPKGWVGPGKVPAPTIPVYRRPPGRGLHAMGAWTTTPWSVRGVNDHPPPSWSFTLVGVVGIRSVGNGGGE